MPLRLPLKVAGLSRKVTCISAYRHPTTGLCPSLKFPPLSPLSDNLRRVLLLLLLRPEMYVCPIYVQVHLISIIMSRLLGTNSLLLLAPPIRRRFLLLAPSFLTPPFRCKQRVNKSTSRQNNWTELVVNANKIAVPYYCIRSLQAVLGAQAAHCSQQH